MHSIIQVFIILLEIIATAALADFVAGAIHWIEDAYFTEDTPLLGPLFIRPNILHHHLPRHFTQLSWWASSKDLLAAGAGLLLVAWGTETLTWQVWLFVGLGVNANQIHKWSHRTRAENGRVISWLQDCHILQTPRHHGLHHKDPKNTYYCPITNLVNPALERISFWPRLEGLIERLTGVTHRADTAVRGQGPGPEWLAAYRSAPRQSSVPLLKFPPIISCQKDCANCSVRCERPRKAA